MTRPRYILIEAAIIVAIAVAAVLLTPYVLVPLIQEMPFVGIEPSLSWRQSFWLSAMMLVLWLVAGPAWPRATLERGRHLERPRWPAWALSAIGFCVIAATFVAGAALGRPPGPLETPEPPLPEKTFSSVEQIMRDADHVEAYLMNVIMEMAMTVCLGSAVLSLVWLLTLLGRDPVPVVERCE